jgi:hypothetical protein
MKDEGIRIALLEHFDKLTPELQENVLAHAIFVRSTFMDDLSHDERRRIRDMTPNRYKWWKPAAEAAQAPSKPGRRKQ